MIFSLPVPPGVNNLFATVTIKGKSRRIISREYKAWREAAAGILSRYTLDPLPKPYGAHIRLNVNHRCDIDGKPKAILDALVTAGIIVDDCWLNKLIVERDRSVEACTVEIWSIEDQLHTVLGEVG